MFNATPCPLLFVFLGEGGTAAPTAVKMVVRLSLVDRAMGVLDRRKTTQTIHLCVCVSRLLLVGISVLSTHTR